MSKRGVRLTCASANRSITAQLGSLNASGSQGDRPTAPMGRRRFSGQRGDLARNRCSQGDCTGAFTAQKSLLCSFESLGQGMMAFSMWRFLVLPLALATLSVSLSGCAFPEISRRAPGAMAATDHKTVSVQGGPTDSEILRGAIVVPWGETLALPQSAQRFVSESEFPVDVSFVRSSWLPVIEDIDGFVARFAQNRSLSPEQLKEAAANYCFALCQGESRCLAAQYFSRDYSDPIYFLRDDEDPKPASLNTSICARYPQTSEIYSAPEVFGSDADAVIYLRKKAVVCSFAYTGGNGHRVDIGSGSALSGTIITPGAEDRAAQRDLTELVNRNISDRDESAKRYFSPFDAEIVGYSPDPVAGLIYGPECSAVPVGLGVRDSDTKFNCHMFSKYCRAVEVPMTVDGQTYPTYRTE